MKGYIIALIAAGCLWLVVYKIALVLIAPGVWASHP